MKRAIIISLLALMIGAFYVAPATAQGVWVCEFDFTTEKGPFKAVKVPGMSHFNGDAKYYSGEGWGPNTEAGLPSLKHFIQIMLDTDVPVTVTEMRLTATGIPGNTMSVAVRDSEGGTWVEGTAESSQATAEWTGSATGYPHLRHRMNSGTNPYRLTYAYIAGTGTAPLGCGPAELVLTQPTDELENAGSTLAVAAGGAVGGRVHAASPGTVIDVRRPGASDCAWFQDNNDASCHFTTSSGTFSFADNDAGTSWLDTWFVQIAGDDGNTYTYLVDDPFVAVDDVVADCAIGLVADVNRVTLVQAGYTPFYFYEAETQHAYAIVAVDDGTTLLDALPAMTEQPTTTDLCNAGTQSQCLGDSQLQYPDQWNSSDVTWQGGSGLAVVAPGGEISQTYAVDAAYLPEMRVKHRSVTGDGDDQLQFGDATTDVSLPNLLWQETTVAAGSADAGAYYTVRLTNTGSTALEVDEICVYHSGDGTGGELVDPPPDPPGPDDPPPGGDYPPGGGDPPPPPPGREPPESCDTVQPASGTDTGAWLHWHWSQIDCYTNTILNSILDVLNSFYYGVTWSIRWSMDVVTLFIDWLQDDLLPWLAGYMNNIGGVTVNNAAGTSFWDVLISIIDELLGPIVQAIIELILTAFDLLFQLVTVLIELILLVISELIDLLALALNLFGGIISAYHNAQPTMIPGMANCSTAPQQNSICLGLWVLEHTIFSGVIGVLIIPIAISFAYIMLAIRSARKILNIIKSTGDSI